MQKDQIVFVFVMGQYAYQFSMLLRKNSPPLLSISGSPTFSTSRFDSVLIEPNLFIDLFQHSILGSTDRIATWLRLLRPELIVSMASVQDLQEPRCSVDVGIGEGYVLSDVV